MKTIVLTGMMGSGKTSVAQNLSKKLNAEFVDIDEIIEKTEGCPISEIFASKGEASFRETEKSTILSTVKPQNQIVALGGGAFENSQVQTFLLETAMVVYLQTSPQAIYLRIKDNRTRPLLKNNMTLDYISSIIKNREINYNKAHFTIVTDKKDVEQVAQEIIEVTR